MDKKMPSCIYCPNPADGKEHWFPRTLGVIKGVDTLLKTVCRECNGALGPLDEEVARTGWTGFSRAAFGIRGRKHHSAVSPFEFRAMSAGQPTELVMPSDRGYLILAEVNPDEKRGTVASPLRQLVFEKANGEIECVPFPKGWNAPQLKQAVENRGLQAEKLIEVYLKGEEGPESESVQRIVTDAIGMFHARCWFGENQEGSVKTVAMKAGINGNYLRGLIKLAFHYFIWSSPTFNGREAEFDDLRALIRHGKGSWKDHLVLGANPFIEQLKMFRPTQPTSFLVSDVNSVHARVLLHLFVTEMLPPIQIVKLGRSPSRVIGRRLVSHRIVYNSPNPPFAGELSEIDVGPKRVLGLR